MRRCDPESTQSQHSLTSHYIGERLYVAPGNPVRRQRICLFTALLAQLTSLIRELTFSRYFKKKHNFNGGVTKDSLFDRPLVPFLLSCVVVERWKAIYPNERPEFNFLRFPCIRRGP